MTDALLPERGAFIDSRATYEFWTFTAATFLTFLTATQALYLSSILQSRGLSPLGIGAVAGSYGIGVIIASLGIQPLLTRIGLLPSVRLGIVLTGVGYGSLALTLDHQFGMMFSRLIQGAGFGVFLTPAIAYARSRLGSSRFLQFLGIYTSSIPLPQAVGPGFAEWQYSISPGPRVFVIGLIPIAVAFLLTFLQRDVERTDQGQKRLSIVAALQKPKAIWPLVAITIVGVLFGFETAFTAPVLSSKAIPVGFFFSAVSAAMFTSQLFILRQVNDHSEKSAIVSSFLFMSASFAVVHFAGTPAAMLIAGALFGFGYSVVFPVLNAAMTRPFQADERTAALAAFNLFYNCGMIVTPYLVGLTVQKSQYGSILLALAVISMLAALAALIAAKGSQEAGS